MEKLHNKFGGQIVIGKLVNYFYQQVKRIIRLNISLLVQIKTSNESIKRGLSALFLVIPMQTPVHLWQKRTQA